MNTYDDVLGHLLARLENGAEARKVLQAYDSTKSKAANSSHLASVTFTKVILESTLDALKNYCAEFYPYAVLLIRSKMVARTKPLIAEDIVAVLYSITPTQCRTCKLMYISTSAENTENIFCFLCGRRSHKECLKEHTIDNAAGVVFLCDPCLTNAETNLILDTDNSNQHNVEHEKPENEHQKPENEHPKPENEATKAAEDTGSKHTAESTNDEICPLYKENSCPHGLTGKRHIDGNPCPKKHPPKCFYFIGKYGSSGCRYSAKKCPYFHPALCENSTKLKMCLNKQCTKYHLSGTKRNMNESQQHGRREERPTDNRYVQPNPPPPPPQMWNPPQTQSSIPQSQQTQVTHGNGGQDPFLTYLHQMKADMQEQMKKQEEMQIRMKSELEQSMINLIRESIQPRTVTEPKMQTSHPVNPQMANPQIQMPQNMQGYHQMYPVLVTNQGGV